MKNLYARMMGGPLGRVVDSGVSGQEKWVTVLFDDGKAETAPEHRWHFVRDEELVRLDPAALEEARHSFEALEQRLRHLAPKEQETVFLSGVRDGMQKVLDLVESGTCKS